MTGDLLAALRAAADPARAEPARRYLKHDRVHLGVAVPEIRTITRAWRRGRPPAEVRAACVSLWDSGVHEAMLAAAFAAQGVVHDVPLFETWLRTGRSWAYIDEIAIHLVGAEPAAVRDPFLDAWSTDGDFWLRRSALLGLIPDVRARRPDLARIERYTAAMVDEREFFIRKALGWLLRELATRDPAATRAWLDRWGDRASGLTRREASRRLPA